MLVWKVLASDDQWLRGRHIPTFSTSLEPRGDWNIKPNIT